MSVSNRTYGLDSPITEIKIKFRTDIVINSFAHSSVDSASLLTEPLPLGGQELPLPFGSPGGALNMKESCLVRSLHEGLDGGGGGRCPDHLLVPVLS